MTNHSPSHTSQLSVVKAAIEQLQRGRFVVVADDAHRENEGDLIGLADRITPEAMAFLVRRTSGVVCAAMSGARLDQLDIPLMVANNTDSQATAFTVTVDYIPGTTTGISASDRAATMRALADARSTPQQFSRPGHIFPLRARPNGVLERRGHTEAAVDLAILSGASPVAAIAELMHDDGTMMRGTELQQFAREHDLVYLTIDELVRYRELTQPLVEHTGSARLPTRHGEFTAHAYRSREDGVEHIALVFGEIAGKDGVMTRLHSECLTGDTFGSLRCDCGPQLDLALRQIALEGAGVLVYMRGHEGRGIGLSAKILAYALQDNGRDTVDANLELGFPIDARRYDAAAEILQHLGVQRVRLLSNNPTKVTALEAAGVVVTERIPLLTASNPENSGYLSTKALRLGHSFNRPRVAAAAAAFDQQRVAVKAVATGIRRR